MQRLNVTDAAEILGITKEAVYNRIRRGSLKSIEKNGQKFVILDDESNLQRQKSKSEVKLAKMPTTKQNELKNDEFIKYLLTQIDEMKAINLNLQADKERLFKEKEQMLVESKNEISQIYKERDEKLMQFLDAIKHPFLAYKDEEAIEAVVEESGISDSKGAASQNYKNDEQSTKWQSLSEYLRVFEFDKVRRKKLQNRIIRQIGRSKFIKFKNGIILVKKNKTLKELIGEI
ncbi:helix-turn-helix domain-containing protein [Campylobacter sp. faydin G-105]|uniref:helix-turn-helix domain-containing protein n=1 Tax=Campylobacter anatolicus TaxID=2829105 RepID=UPI001B8E8528|nr:helix-turn-helix domain-containing protein [Campylobacter anatolicus]MBR8462306.1 helix-turn-helix domain-containing protein [Campylobacter anatolicus]